MTYEDLLIISPGCLCSQYGYNYIFTGNNFVEENSKTYSVYSFQKVNVGFKFEAYNYTVDIKFEIYNKQIGLDLRTNYNKSQLELLETISIKNTVEKVILKNKFQKDNRYQNYMKQFGGNQNENNV